MVKKLICLFTVITLIAVPAGVFSEEDMTKNEKAIAVVTGLGFLDAVPDTNEVVTRADFVTATLRLYNTETADEFGEGIDTVYEDVDAAHYRSRDIAKAYDLGIFKGYDNNCFYPDRAVSASEVSKVLLELLGYTLHAEYQGGYPTGYMIESNSLGLFNGAASQADEGMTYAKLARVIYNAMSKEVLSVSGIRQDQVDMTKIKGRTFLEIYHNMYKSSGIVTANSVTRLNGPSDLGENTIEIDSVLYRCENALYNDYLGLNVEYYWRDDAAGELCFAIAERNDILEIDCSEIEAGTAGDTISYTDDSGRSGRKVTMAQNGNVIYNGIYQSKVINFDMSTLVGMPGRVRLIDTSDDGSYDVLIVTEYINYVVETVNMTEEVLLLRYQGGALDLSGRLLTCRLIKDGNNIALSDIASGDLISVAASKNFYSAAAEKKNIRIEVSTQYVNGSVDSIGEDAVYLTYQANEGSANEEFKISPTFVSENNRGILLKDAGIFYIDALGHVAYLMQGGSVGMRYGYVMAVDIGKGLNATYKIRMMDEGGKIAVLNTAEKIKLDGETGKHSLETIDLHLQQNEKIYDTRQQLVRYMTNANGEIINLDTALPNSDSDPDQLTETQWATGLYYHKTPKLFRSTTSITRYILDDDTKVFIVPMEAGAKDEDYLVRSSTYFSAKTYGNPTSGENMFAYNVTEATPKAMVLQTNVADTGLGGIQRTTDAAAVIKQKFNGVDENGESYIGLRVMHDNEEKVLKINENDVRLLRMQNNSEYNGTPYVDETAENPVLLTMDNFNFGDVVLFYIGNDQWVQTLLKLTDRSVIECSADGEQKYGVQKMASSLERIIGSVRNITGTKMLLDISNPEGYLYINANYSKLQVYIVYTDRKHVTTGTLKDVIYSEDDTQADKAFFRINSGTVRQIIVYR